MQTLTFITNNLQILSLENEKAYFQNKEICFHISSIFYISSLMPLKTFWHNYLHNTDNVYDLLF